MKSFLSHLRRRLSPMPVAVRRVEELCRQQTVQQGPFRGLRFSVESSFISHRPVLLGTYERELWPWFEEAARQCDAYVVVGAAEGYYAVGLAIAGSGGEVTAFEMDSKGRDLIEHNAALNETANVAVRGRCDADDLRAALGGAARPFVLVDVEGAEADIVTGIPVSGLAHAFLLVEIHDFVDRSLADRLRQHLADTHSCEEVWQQPRKISDLPSTLPWRRLLGRWYVTLLSEDRPERMRWLFFKPRT